MKRPELKVADSDARWVSLLRDRFGAGGKLHVVCTPSVEAQARRLCAGFDVRQVWSVRREPSVADFAWLEQVGPADLVVGMGGGKALDAAKVVAHWGIAYGSVAALDRVLSEGGRIDASGRSRLVLVPSIASSGSESSVGAIVSVGEIKTGLRGPSLSPDLVIHDARLWQGLSDDVRRHYAFDVFAHLLETALSLRRSADAAAAAAEGGPRMLRWYAEDSPARNYGEIMQAAFAAGLCLANSSTCLPHRIQYAIGPKTDTGHVEGVWMLFPGWLEAIRRAAPARLHEAFAIISGRMMADAEIGELCATLHRRAAAGVRRDRFVWSSVTARKMASAVRGDLAADPSYRDVGSIERQLLAISNHD